MPGLTVKRAADTDGTRKPARSRGHAQLRVSHTNEAVSERGSAAAPGRRALPPPAVAELVALAAVMAMTLVATAAARAVVWLGRSRRVALPATRVAEVQADLEGA